MDVELNSLHKKLIYHQTPVELRIFLYALKFVRDFFDLIGFSHLAIK
jgi:hypothetical protein